MILKLFTLFFILLNFATAHAQKPNSWVIFGEHSEKITYNINQEYHIHLDRNGDFYPQTKILDKNLKTKGKNQLKVWAQEYPADFTKIAAYYNLEKTNYTKQNYRILQDSIINNIAKTINKYTKDKYQTWLVHGFRKNLYQPIDYVQSTSLNDNRIIKESINKYLNLNSKLQTYFVEVYWDGRFLHNYGISSATKLAEMFKKAIPNAQNCGYSLRGLFTKIDSKNINIITHSTGTHLATNLLYNVIDNFNYEKPTPKNNIKLVLVGSASSGKRLFKNYYNRNTSNNFIENDNYTIINSYNKKDGVLRKNLFYPTRASTKLGCNYQNESGKLFKFFRRKFKHSKYIDWRNTYNSSDRNFNHAFFNYIKHTSFEKVFSIIYNE
jgi:hypothetical protein